jgi:hypothetical protein
MNEKYWRPRSSIPTPGSAAPQRRPGTSGGPGRDCHVLPPSLDEYTRSVFSEKLFDPARRTFGLRGSIAIAGSFCGPGAFETSTFATLEAAVQPTPTAAMTTRAAPTAHPSRQMRAPTIRALCATQRKRDATTLCDVPLVGNFGDGAPDVTIIQGRG